MDENLPVITESAFNSQFGGNGSTPMPGAEEDLPVIPESQFNKLAEVPTWGQSAKFVGRNLVAGIGDIAGLALDVMPGGTDMFLPEEVRASSKVKNLLTNIFGSPTTKDNNLTGMPAEIIGAGVRGSVFPGGVVANTAASAGAKTGELLFPDSIAAPILGAVGGAGLVGATKASANILTNAGKAFERSSIGASAKNYLKSLKTNGLIDDVETGELSTKLSKSINEIGDTEGWGLFRDPERLAQRNQAVLDDVGEKIGTTLELASATGTKPIVDFTSPNSAVGKLISNSKAEKKQIKEAFDEFLDGFTDPTDGWAGDISSLNQWKSSIQNQAFSGSAKGSLSAPVQRRLQRAIANDLKSAVDKGVIDSGVVSADDWAQTMSLYGRHADVAPILNEGVAKGLGNAWDKTIRGALRTSGGVLTTPTLIAGGIGGAAGGPIGLGIGLGLGALSSPTGSGVAGSALKNTGRVLGSVTGGSKKAASLAGLLSNVLGKDDNSSQVVAPIKEALQTSTTGQIRSPDTDLTPRSDMAKSKQDIELEIDADPFYALAYKLESNNGTQLVNPKSSAKGAFQLIDATAKTLGVKDPMDLEQNFEGFKKLTEENKARFQTDNPAVLYAAHFLGAPTLEKWLNGEALSDAQQKHVNEFKDILLPRVQKFLASRQVQA